MNSARCNPDSEENQRATRDNERYIGGLRLQHQYGATTIKQLTEATMTLAERNAIIDGTVRSVERQYPLLSPSAILEIASARLGRDDGLAVTPDEIMRVLSALAEARP